MNTSEHNGVTVSVDELLALRTSARDFKLGGRKTTRATIDGSAKSSRRGRGMEFAEVRPYQAGDDIRNIDWRVTARTQETYTKLFQEEKERPVFIAVDQRSPLFFGSKHQFKSVMAAKVAGLICWAAFANRDRIGSIIFNDRNQSDLRPKQGKFALLRFIHELAAYNQQLVEDLSSKEPTLTPAPIRDKLSLRSIFEELQRIVRPGSLVYIISDFHDFDETCEKSLAVLSRHNDIEVMNVFDPLEANLPSIGLLHATDGQQNTVIDSSSKLFASRYQSEWQQRITTLERAAMKFGCRFANLDCGLSDFELIHYALRGKPLSNLSSTHVL